MPDEIMPRDRAELLWNAIINHTIEAVDAIRDRPELIAAAIAAGLPDMLGDPRDRYEMFLKAIAGAQGDGGAIIDLVGLEQSTTKWNLTLFPAFDAGHELTVTFHSNVPESTEYIFSFGQYNTIHIAPNINNFHARVFADAGHEGKITIELVVSNSSTITVDNCDPSVDHTIKINEKMYVDGTDYGTLPSRLYNGFDGLLEFGNMMNNRLNGTVSKFTYK